MEIPNILKGEFYPSSRVSRCMRFHRCTITNKCQSYDRHLEECNLCEARTNAHELAPESVPLGGHLPEGEFYPDLQDAIGYLERMLGRSFAHPDAEGQKVNNYDTARNWEKEHKVAEMLRQFSSEGKLTMEEKIMKTYVDPDLAKRILGRLE